MVHLFIEEMRVRLSNISSVQELVDIYVYVHNKFWYTECDVYDYEEGTPEYNKACLNADSWYRLMDELDELIMNRASEEGLLLEPIEGFGTVKRLEKFMKMYGYRNSSGWWIKE